MKTSLNTKGRNKLIKVSGERKFANIQNLKGNNEVNENHEENY